jgi:putative NADPH-quinone reductase
MGHISVILAHPTQGSFNHAIAAAAVTQLQANGHAVYLHDLYAEGFEPLIASGEAARGASLPRQIATHCDEIAQADGIVIVHPNWWGQPPAILKGWVDRVIRPGVAYEFLEGDSGEGVPRGLLQAKGALVLNTSNTSLERERTVFADPLETIWRNCIFGLCGVHNVRRRMFTIVVTSTHEQRQAWLAETRSLANELFPRCFAADRA